MDTATAHLSRRSRQLAASAVLISALSLVLASHTPAASGRVEAALAQTRTVATGVRAHRPSYGWPVKPFNRQHPVRGYLNDPRNGLGAKSFHFGIDISAPDGTPVYAVESGEVFITRGRDAVAVKGAQRTFGYWHVQPSVRDHQYVRTHQLLGHITKRQGHVHLAERHNGIYLNPLRPGGIGPYADHTPPKVASVEFLRRGVALDAQALSGKVDIVVEAFDMPPTLVPQPWSRLPVTPARIRWSIERGSRRIVSRHTAADFSRTKMFPSVYDSIYAPGTFQNQLGKRGHYRFYLAHHFDTARLPLRPSEIRIAAFDTRGNRVVATLEVARAS
jgi:Peptidase family M23